VQQPPAVRLAGVGVVRRVQPPVERAVDVAGAVEGVEANVQPNVKNKGAPRRMQPRLDGGVIDFYPRPDHVPHREPHRLQERDLQLRPHRSQAKRLERPALVLVRHRLHGPRLEEAYRKDERPIDRWPVEADALRELDETHHGEAGEDDHRLLRPQPTDEAAPPPAVGLRRGPVDPAEVEGKSCEPDGQHALCVLDRRHRDGKWVVWQRRRWAL